MSDANPTPPPPSIWRALTAGELSVESSRNHLSTADAQFSAWTTYTVPGVVAPIDQMLAECPEKVINAGSDPFYGLENPTSTDHTVQTADAVADKTAGTDDEYTGAYIALRKGETLVSLFPDGTATIETVDGVTSLPGAKVLKGLTITANVSNVTSVDANGREWGATRVEVSSTQAIPTKYESLKLKEELETQWLQDPCGD